MGIFADLFIDMMATTVTVQEIIGRDTYGAPVFGSPRSYVARVNNLQRNVIGPEGQLVVSRGRAWLDTVDAMTVNDRFTLADGSEVKMLNVNQVPDETGPAYTSLDMQ